MINELPIPQDAIEEAESNEIIRGWLVNGKLQISLLPTIWEDEPETWGLLLADTAQHISNAISESTGTSKEEIINKIKTLLINELNSPTAEVEGDFVK